MGAEGSRKPAPGHESPEPRQATTAHQQSRLCLPDPSLRGRAPLTGIPRQARRALPSPSQGSSGILRPHHMGRSEALRGCCLPQGQPPIQPSAGVTSTRIGTPHRPRVAQLACSPHSMGQRAGFAPPALQTPGSGPPFPSATLNSLGDLAWGRPSQSRPARARPELPHTLPLAAPCCVHRGLCPAPAASSRSCVCSCFHVRQSPAPLSRESDPELGVEELLYTDGHDAVSLDSRPSWPFGREQAPRRRSRWKMSSFVVFQKQAPAGCHQQNPGCGKLKQTVWSLEQKCCRETRGMEGWPVRDATSCHAEEEEAGVKGRSYAIPFAGHLGKGRNYRDRNRTAVTRGVGVHCTGSQGV